ncbi:MAG: patatin-like phospholipase family protein [Kofleriaceae bacterium]
MIDPVEAPVTGLVLAGASALGAYEVGVLSYLYESVLPEASGAAPSVFCGTSAGAINATALAAHVDHPLIATSLLARSWRAIDLESVLRPSVRSIIAMLLDVTGAPSVVRHASWSSAPGGVIGNETIASLVGLIPFDALAEHVASGDVRGVAVTATRVADGSATVFYASHGNVPRWPSAANVSPTPALLTAKHVLASAAIPLLFPAVTIADEAYCDGGLRQMVPLSPAIHLGARRLLVINPLPSVRHPTARSPNAASPLYLAGKALNALFADRLEADLANARRTSAILRAGTTRFGPGFQEAIDEQLIADGGVALQPIDAMCIEPTLDLGSLAAEHVRSPAFKSRANSLVGRLLYRIADGEPERMADLLAYVLFDADFIARLIEAGRDDARSRHAELAAWFSLLPS